MSQPRDDFRRDDNQAHEVISNFTHTLDESMIRSMIECFSIQQGIINVPVFDGENMPVRDFIEDVMNGALVVPAECEKRYVTAVLSRLKGTARSSTYGRTFSNLKELSDHLKQRYAPRKAYSWYISEMATVQLSRGENVSDFYDRITSLRLGAQAVLEDKYENVNLHCLLLNDCALEAFIRGLPDKMSAFVESQYPNTSEIALKYALDYEAKHQTNSQILRQQDSFDLRDRSSSPRAQFTPSHNGQDATNPAPKATQHIQIQTNTSAFDSQYQCTPHTDYNTFSYMPLSQTNEDHLFDHKTNRYPNFRNKIYENTSAKTEEKEPGISVKILMQRRNLLKQEIRQEEGSSLNIQESKTVENIIPKVTILTNSKTEKGENREKEVIVTETGSQKLSSCQSLGNPNSLFKEEMSEVKSELISNSRKRKNNTSEILDANLSPIERIGLTKVHQPSTPARTMYGSDIQTISPIPYNLYTSLASEPFVLPERYDKQDILEPYSLLKSWNAIQWNTGQERRGIG